MRWAQCFVFILAIFPALPFPKETGLPDASFWSNYTLLFLACLLVFYYGVRQSFKKNNVIGLSWLGLFFIFFIALALLQFALRKIISSQEIIVFSGIFLLLVAVSSLFTIANPDTKKSLIYLMAQGLVIGGLLQAVQVIGEINGYQIIEWEWVNYPFSANERPGGRFFQPNQMAAYVFLSVLSACFLWVQKRIKTRQAFILLIILMLALSLSKSRAAVIYVLLVLPVYEYLIYKHEKNLNWLKPTGAILLFFVAEAAVYCFYGQNNNLISRTASEFSLGTRLSLVKDAWLIFVQHPILGVGLNQYGGARNLLYPEGNLTEPNAMHAHNLSLNLLAETGLIGVGFLVVLIVIKTKIIIKQGLSQESIYLIVSLFLIGLYSHSEYPLWLPFFLLLTTVYLSLLANEYALQIKLKAIFLKLTGMISLLFISAWLYAGYEYRKVSEIYKKGWTDSPVPDEVFVEATEIWSKNLIWSLEMEKLLLVMSIEHPLYQGLVTITSKNVFKQFPFPEFAPGQALILHSQNKNEQAQAVINRICRAFPYACENVKARYQYYLGNMTN